MSDLYWLTDEQMARLPPYFPKSHDKPRVDDRRMLGGIVFVNRNGLRWCDAPKDCGPHKTLWKRLGERGVFLRMMEGLASAEAEPKTVMIDATYLKAHRTASGLRVKRGSRPSDRPHERRHEHQVACCCRRGRPALELFHDRRLGQRLHRRGSPARLPKAQWLLGDRGYDADRFRDALQAKGIQPCIPGRRSRNEPVRYDKRRYRSRSRIEIMFGRLKDSRRVATRYDRCPTVFFSAIAIALAATVIFWL